MHNQNFQSVQNFLGLEHIDSGESNLKRWGDASEVKSAKTIFILTDVLYGKLRSYLDKAVIAKTIGRNLRLNRYSCIYCKLGKRFRDF